MHREGKLTRVAYNTGMNASSNTYSYTRDQTLQRFAEHIFDAGEALVLVATDTHCGQAEHEALDRSMAALGWNQPPTYVLVDTPSPLGKAQFFELVEGLDPVWIILVGHPACTLAEDAYQTDIPECGTLRLFGRNACAFADLGTLLQTNAGKQRVWKLLKSLEA